jgi:hypothetical protein
VIVTDLKDELKTLYSAPTHPIIVDVPEMRFLMIDGRGDPETSADFAEAVQALYSVSYGVKFALKNGAGVNRRVMPLEGLWWAEDPVSFVTRRASDWQWTMMIAQPPEATAVLVQEASAAAWRKREAPALWKLRFEPFREGLAAQILHIGPYATEGETIRRLHDFVEAEGYVLSGRHHEIYLGNPRRAAPERLKTIVRHPVTLA